MRHVYVLTERHGRVWAPRHRPASQAGLTRCEPSTGSPQTSTPVGAAAPINEAAGHLQDRVADVIVREPQFCGPFAELVLRVVSVVIVPSRR